MCLVTLKCLLKFYILSYSGRVNTVHGTNLDIEYFTASFYLFVFFLPLLVLCGWSEHFLVFSQAPCASVCVTLHVRMVVVFDGFELILLRVSVWPGPAEPDQSGV